MFRVLPIKDKELFLRYAIPCGGVLVRRGELREELLRRLNRWVRDGEETDLPVGNIFKVATRMCTILAKRLGKNEIDAEVIRRYFLIEHEKALRWRKEIKPDLNVKECLVYPGRILKVSYDKILVKTPLGEKFFRKDFVGNLKRNDWVSVHYDYVAEKIKTSYVNRMLKRGRNG